MPERAPLRSPRAAVFASVCVGVSASGHALASGHGVPFAGLAAGFLLVFLTAYAVASQERSFGLICGWMAWGQMALHILFSVFHPTERLPVSGLARIHSSGHLVLPDSTADSSAGAGMLLAHVLALLVSAWWLRQGESSLFTLLRLLRRLLWDALFVLVIPPLRAWGRSVPVWHHRVAAGSASLGFLRHILVRRGPPLLFPT